MFICTLLVENRRDLMQLFFKAVVLLRHLNVQFITFIFFTLLNFFIIFFFEYDTIYINLLCSLSYFYILRFLN